MSMFLLSNFYNCFFFERLTVENKIHFDRNSKMPKGKKRLLFISSYEQNSLPVCLL